MPAHPNPLEPAAPLIVRPNANVQRFTAQHHPGLQYLGTVQREMEIGALARTLKGGYVRVNGSLVEPLNKADVERALDAVGVRPSASEAPTAHAAAPTVIIRRKRRVLEPGSPEAAQHAAP